MQKLLISALFLFFPIAVHAQISPDSVEPDSSKTVEITLIDNSSQIGQILSVKDTELELRKENERTFIELARIKSIRDLDTTQSGYDWFKNPNESRLLISPTARPLEKGSGYYQNIYVFISGVAYGITDNIALTGGISMIPGLGVTNQLYFVSGKYGGQISDNHYLSGGLGVVSVGGADDGLIFGYGNYTYEFNRGSLTTGVTGFSLPSEDVGTTTFLFGGDYRISQRVAFVSENYFFPEAGDGIFSYGVRLMGERLSFDLAFFRSSLDDGLGFGIPYVDFVFNF
ncbi:MAG: hypothetical protein WD381_02820, partial [Balneolaceae bacterium]